MVSGAHGKPEPKPKPVAKPALKPCHHPGCMTPNRVLRINNRAWSGLAWPYFDYGTTSSEVQFGPLIDNEQDKSMVFMNRMASMNPQAEMNQKISTHTMVGINRKAFLNRMNEKGKKFD